MSGFESNKERRAPTDEEIEYVFASWKFDPDDKMDDGRFANGELDEC